MSQAKYTWQCYIPDKLLLPSQGRLKKYVGIRLWSTGRPEISCDHRCTVRFP